MFDFLRVSVIKSRDNRPQTTQSTHCFQIMSLQKLMSNHWRSQTASCVSRGKIWSIFYKIYLFNSFNLHPHIKLVKITFSRNAFLVLVQSVRCSTTTVTRSETTLTNCGRIRTKILYWSSNTTSAAKIIYHWWTVKIFTYFDGQLIVTSHF